MAAGSVAFGGLRIGLFNLDALEGGAVVVRSRMRQHARSSHSVQRPRLFVTRKGLGGAPWTAVEAVHGRAVVGEEVAREANGVRHLVESHINHIRKLEHIRGVHLVQNVGAGVEVDGASKRARQMTANEHLVTARVSIRHGILRGNWPRREELAK